MADPTPALGIVFGVKANGEVVAASWYGDPPFWDSRGSATSFCSYAGMTPVDLKASDTGQIDAFFKAMQDVDEIGAGA